MSSGQEVSTDALRRQRVASLSRKAPALDADRVLELAERHLSALAEEQRIAPGVMPRTRAPRLRTAVRAMWLAWVAVQAALDAAWRWVSGPRHLPGRWWRRVRLLKPLQTFSVTKFLAVPALVVLGSVAYGTFADATAKRASAGDKAVAAVLAALFTGLTVALLRSVWDDLVRLPLVAARIRWRIRWHPECVRRPDIASRAALADDERLPLEIVPRTDLYDDLLPGVLTRQHKDVQIVVGDPGSGKTTALISIARELARAGIVPVLVPMRSTGDTDLVPLAHARLVEQVETYLPADRAELLWRWLCKRRRVAILTDDLDRISPDGERGFMLRRALADAELRDLPVIVTARPAGVPAGIAASAIELGSLDEGDAVDAVVKGVRRSPGHTRKEALPREPIARWVSQGRLAEVPFYLELLARLAAAGTLPAVTEPIVWRNTRSAGWYRILPDGTAELNPWFVRFELLDHFRRGVSAGQVGRWLGIETRERSGALRALEAAALGTLRAMALSAAAKALPREERASAEPERTDIVDFIDTDDRSAEVAAAARDGESTRGLRQRFSAQEIVETAERLQILDRDGEDRLQFRHRIMQAYLAGRCLARIEYDRRQGAGQPAAAADLADDWWHDLLDHRHPEKLTAQMALTFAAIHATAKAREVRATQKAAAQRDGSAGRRSDAGTWSAIGVTLVEALVARARLSLERTGAAGGEQAAARGFTMTIASERRAGASLLSVQLPADGRADRRSRSPRDIDPMHARDPEARRDPDDALIKLTTAADIARIVELPEDGEGTTTAQILREVDHSSFVTRWTKLSAIRAIAALETPARWQHVWSYACDPDYLVREAASGVLEESAHAAYRELGEDVDALIVRAAARNALGLELDATPDEPDATGAIDWSDDDRLHLKALGTVLPAIVSGLREDPSTHAPEAWRGHDGDDGEQRRFDALARGAGTALERLVTLAFQGDLHDLEAAVAKGFRADALRHLARDGAAAATNGPHTGPGWVATHARLVSTVGLPRTQYWYAQIVLAQALALYAIAGANRRFALDNLGRFVHRGGDARHPFTQRAARLARTALLRELVHSRRWRAYIWEDEVQGAGRQRLALTVTAAQLLADVTLLLDLNEGAQEDRKEPFAHMRELPYCLDRSRDRSEIVAKGCPSRCGWNFCPYKQPPPDEPNDHRGVSRAFCRQQRRIAWHRLRWQRRISRRRLRSFWREMERRART